MEWTESQNAFWTMLSFAKKKQIKTRHAFLSL